MRVFITQILFQRSEYCDVTVQTVVQPYGGNVDGDTVKGCKRLDIFKSLSAMDFFIMLQQVAFLLNIAGSLLLQI